MKVKGDWTTILCGPPITKKSNHLQVFFRAMAAPSTKIFEDPEFRSGHGSLNSWPPGQQINAQLSQLGGGNLMNRNQNTKKVLV